MGVVMGRPAELAAFWWRSAGRRQAHPSRRRARCPSPRRPITTAAAWWPLTVTGRLVCWLSGSNQYCLPHLVVQPGSAATTHNPALVAIPTSTSRNARVGMAPTVRRKRLPRAPRPRVSRPCWRASAKSRFSTTTERQPCSVARRMIVATAARSRPWRVEAGNPSSSRGMVWGGPSGLPAGLSTQQSRWVAFRSTPSARSSRSASSDGACLAGSRQDASAYQRRRFGSRNRS